MTTAELVAESRRRQGLPPRIADPATLARLAAILTNTKAARAIERPGRPRRPAVSPATLSAQRSAPWRTSPRQ